MIALWTAVLAFVANPSAAQTLHVERLPGGTEFIFVTQPLSAATTVSWSTLEGGDQSITRGELNLIADTEQELTLEDPVSPVIIAVGGSQLPELRSMLERVLAGRPLAAAGGRSPVPAEGGVDRRLGGPGSRALVRLDIPLPAPNDGRRSSAEVLWELIPALLHPDLPGFRGRIEGDRGRLEGDVDPDLAELELRQLRLALARLGDSARLDDDAVGVARLRIEVRRKALLGTHPDAAELLVQRWLEGGIDAVRQYLFGIEGVTEQSVRAVARDWLPSHPGQAVLMLPPQFFNPRFALGPEIIQLDNDLMAAVLERPGAGLSAVNLRPVLLPDVDGAETATVLARVAAEMRASGSAPGWIRVLEDPPALELATSPDGLPEMLEVLQAALERVSEDDLMVGSEGGGGRRRALQLMAGVLGLAEGMEQGPAALLRPGNLAVGVVSPDAETAIESMAKFGLGGSSPSAMMVGRSMQPVPRTREAASGGESTLVIALEFGVPAGDIVVRAAADVVVQRARAQEIAADVAAIHPVVPGRKVALIVLSAPGPLAELEKRVEKGWSTMVAGVDEVELIESRRRLAASVAADSSGPLGRARLCAAAAAGDVAWRSPTDLELEIMTLSAEQIDGVLEQLPTWEDASTTGAGVLPVPAVTTP